MLDTMKAYNNMLEAGVEEKQAVAITKEIASAVNKGDLVTKEYLRAELLQTEKKLETKISDVKNELLKTEKKLETKISDVKNELLKTEKKLEEKINKNLWWMISTMIAMTGLIIAVLK